MGEKAVVMTVRVPRRRGPEHARMVSWRWVGSIWFSLVLSALGLVYGPAPRRGCPGCVPRVWVSHSEKGSCSVPGFLHTAQTAVATAKHRGVRGHTAGPAVPPSCPCVGTKQHPRAQPRPPPCVPVFVTTAASGSLPSTSLSPLEVSEIPNSQSSFSIFSIYVGVARKGSAPPTHRHWSISRSWHLCTRLVQLREQL